MTILHSYMTYILSFYTPVLINSLPRNSNNLLDNEPGCGYIPDSRSDDCRGAPGHLIMHFMQALFTESGALWPLFNVSELDLSEDYSWALCLSKHRQIGCKLSRSPAYTEPELEWDWPRKYLLLLLRHSEPSGSGIRQLLWHRAWLSSATTRERNKHCGQCPSADWDADWGTEIGDRSRSRGWNQWRRRSDSTPQLSPGVTHHTLLSIPTTRKNGLSSLKSEKRKEQKQTLFVIKFKERGVCVLCPAKNTPRSA